MFTARPNSKAALPRTELAPAAMPKLKRGTKRYAWHTCTCMWKDIRRKVLAGNLARSARRRLRPLPRAVPQHLQLLRSPPSQRRQHHTSASGAATPSVWPRVGQRFRCRPTVVESLPQRPSCPRTSARRRAAATRRLRARAEAMRRLSDCRGITGEGLGRTSNAPVLSRLYIIITSFFPIVTLVEM